MSSNDNQKLGHHGEGSAMPHRNYFIRQAASLLRFAKETSNSEMATVLMTKAAEFNEKLDEVSLSKTIDASPRAPDVEPQT
jgi:hypothetical protein